MLGQQRGLKIGKPECCLVKVIKPLATGPYVTPATPVEYLTERERKFGRPIHLRHQCHSGIRWLEGGLSPGRSRHAGPVGGRGNGRKQITPNRCGTPQGGVISPLLAKVYLNPLDHGVNGNTTRQAHMIRYAGDFVIACRVGQSAGIKQWLERWLRPRD
jgi:hypothetical protein